MDYTYQIRLRRGTSSQWSIKNPILASGEPGYATDLNQYKIGDGVRSWTDLPFVSIGDAEIPEGANFGVWVGPDQPTDPNVLLWADTDAVGSTGPIGSNVIVVNSLEDVPLGTPAGTVIVVSSDAPQSSQMVGMNIVYGHTDVAPYVIPYPAGTAEGDYVILVAHNQASAVTLPPNMPGWDLLHSWEIGSSGYRGNQAYGKFVGAGENEVTVELFSGGAGSRRIGGVVVLRGVQGNVTASDRISTYNTTTFPTSAVPGQGVGVVFATFTTASPDTALAQFANDFDYQMALGGPNMDGTTSATWMGLAVNLDGAAASSFSIQGPSVASNATRTFLVT